jgi:hypothetical protein
MTHDANSITNESNNLQDIAKNIFN